MEVNIGQFFIIFRTYTVTSGTIIVIFRTSTVLFIINGMMNRTKTGISRTNTLKLKTY